MIQCCSEAIERQGIHAVGLAVSKLGGIFREQSTSDYGIDAMFEARSVGSNSNVLRGPLIGSFEILSALLRWLRR